MFWLKLTGVLLLHTLLLPLKLIVSLIVRIVWFPGFNEHDEVEPSVLPQVVSSSDVDITAMLQDGDGMKFLGLLYFGTGEERFWKVLLSLVDEGGGLHRTFPHNKDFPAVSGDMICGLLLAVMKRLERGEEVPSKVEKAFCKIAFAGWPFKIAHPFKSDFSRGFVFTPWEPVYGTNLTAMAFCAVAYKLTGKKALKVCYSLFKWLGWPLSFNADYSLWVSPVYMKWWYVEHSKTCLAFAGWLCNCDKAFSSFADKLAARYPHNPDIVFMSAIMNSKSQKNMGVQCALKFFYNYNPFLKAFCLPAPTVPMKGYFSLRSFCWKWKAKNVLAPSFRLGSKYLWETCPLDKSAPPKAKGWYADYFFTNALVSRLPK